MQKLTKKYEDGSFGVADNLPVGENSYEFKNLLINTLGQYEHGGFSFTERELEMLKQFAEVYRKERDCDCTNDPIVTVQTREERVVPEGYGGERRILIINDGDYDTVKNEEEFIQYLIDSEDSHYMMEVEVEGEDEPQLVFNRPLYEDELSCYVIDGYEGEEQDHPGIPGIQFRIIFQEEYWKNVAYFFTREEAEKYCKYQKHNLSSPRVYTLYAGYGNNGDYPVFLYMLKRLGEYLLETQQDTISG